MNLIEKNPAKRIPVRQPEKSRIDLSHYVLGSGQLGLIMPIGWYEIVPGDSLRLSSNIRIDYAPVLRPFMTRIDAYIHHHWVPFRICMPRLNVTNSDWEAFIQGDPEEEFNNDIVPHITITNSEITAGCFDLGSLNSYFGLPIIDSAETTSQTFEINLLPQIAYWLCIDEYYRNEWLLERLCGPTSNWTISLQGGDLQGAVGQAIMATQPHGAKKAMDYFWGATPQAYKGSSTDVELDLDAYDGSATHSWSVSVPGSLVTGAPTSLDVDASGHLEVGGTDVYLGGAKATDGKIPIAVLEVMELRRIQALTRFLEAENRLGTDDYEEWLLSVFGVQNPDFRDKSPRYLGGGKLRTNVNKVVNPGDVLQGYTSQTVVVPAGFEAGMAGVQGSSNTVTLHATEYGIVISLLSLVPYQMYGNRIDRFFTKGATGDRLDFYNPYFQNIGDQEIYDYEMGFQLDSDNTGTWGYQQRWAEYKYKPSYVVGEFAVDAGSGGLDDFHMAYIHDITAAPDALTHANSMIQHAADENIRIFQSQGSEHHLYYTVYNDAQFVRPMYLTDIPV